MSSKEFQPMTIEVKSNEFTAWEFQAQIEQDPAATAADPQVLLQDAEEQLRQEAFQQGYQEGMQKAQSDIDAKMQELTTWIQWIKKPISLIDDEVTQELLQTVIWMCHECIRVELSVHPDKLLAIFKEIKSELTSVNGKKELAMNQVDVAWLKEHLPTKDWSEVESIITTDDALGAGDFYVKGEHSELDGRLHTRLVTICSKYLEEDNLVTPIPSQES